MPSRDRLLPWLVIPLVALLAILPLLLYGCSCGHDLDFHLLSWQEAAAQFAHGNLHPRWAFTPAFGAGEPRFVFYPPLSWTIGALLTLLAQHLQPVLPHISPARIFATVPIAYTWLALTAAGLAMHHLARRFLPPAIALLVSILYLANPYTLFTAYERTAFAELLAAAWLPLLLAAILPSGPADTLPILSTAIPLALLWLTNAPAAVLGSYALAAVILLRLISLARRPETRPQALPLALRSIAATALGLALAAFYILPAVLERPWVQIALAVVPGMRPDDNTLFHHTPDPDHDAVLHTASLLALLLLILTAVALSARIRSDRSRGRLLQNPGPGGSWTDLWTLGPVHLTANPAPTSPLFGLLSPRPLPVLAALTLTIALLLTPLSLPLWHRLPELAFLQFPWRLLALLAPITALAFGLALPSRPLSRPVVLALALLLPAALITPAWHTFHQECDPDDTPEARFALFHSPRGDDPTDEYTPTSADNDSLRHNNPPFRLLPLSANDDTPPPATNQAGPAPLALDLHLSTPALLVLNLRDYPTWLVLRNGHPDPDRAPRADGLLALPLPSGNDQLQIRQHTPSLEFAADVLSFLTLLGVACASIAKRRRNP